MKFLNARRHYAVLALLLVAAGCDSKDPAVEDECCENPTGLVVHTSTDGRDLSDRKIGPFAAATTVTFRPDARATATAGSEGTVTIALLLDGAPLCEASQRGTRALRATGECKATLPARRPGTLGVRVTATNATRQATTVVVEW